MPLRQWNPPWAVAIAGAGAAAATAAATAAAGAATGAVDALHVIGAVTVTLARAVLLVLGLVQTLPRHLLPLAHWLSWVQGPWPAASGPLKHVPLMQW